MADIDEGMDIGTAERLLGFHGAYTKAELSSTYRQAIKDNHPDFAKSEADKEARTKRSAAINNAYRKLMPLFSGKPADYRMPCSPEKAADASTTSTTYAATNTARTTTTSGSGSAQYSWSSYHPWSQDETATTTSTASRSDGNRGKGNGTAGNGTQSKSTGTGKGSGKHASSTTRGKDGNSTSKNGTRTRSKKGRGKTSSSSTHSAHDGSAFVNDLNSAVMNSASSPVNPQATAGTGTPMPAPDPKLVAQRLRKIKLEKAAPEWMERNDGLRRAIRTVMLVVFVALGFFGGSLGVPSAVANAGFIALVVEGFSGIISRSVFRRIANVIVGKALDLSEG